jgi:hypothetical protein
MGPTEEGLPFVYLKTETDPVSKTCFLKKHRQWTKSKNMILSSFLRAVNRLLCDDRLVYSQWLLQM